MTNVVWSPAAEAALRRVHWRRASEIDAAVIAFASTGHGSVTRVRNHPAWIAMRVAEARVILRVEPCRLCQHRRERRRHHQRLHAVEAEDRRRASATRLL